jgi:hypothetical protein
MYPVGHLSNYAPDYKYAQSMPASIAPARLPERGH